MLLAAMSARAQIGYKGQVALGVSGGISNVGGFVSTVRIDSYLSERSILGAGIILDRTRYDATQGVPHLVPVPNELQHFYHS